MDEVTMTVSTLVTELSNFGTWAFTTIGSIVTTVYSNAPLLVTCFLIPILGSAFGYTRRLFSLN